MLERAVGDRWKGVYSLCTAGAVAVVAACIQWRERRLIDAILLSGIINWYRALPTRKPHFLYAWKTTCCVL